MLYKEEHGELGSFRLYRRSDGKSDKIQIELRNPGGSKTRLSSGTADKAAAIDEARRQLRLRFGVSFDEAAVAMLEGAKLKPATHRRYLVSIRNLRPHFGGQGLQSITSENLKVFVAFRKQQGVTDSTIRRDLACLSAVISYAIDTLPGAPEHNAVMAFSKKRLKEKARTRFLTRLEVERLKRATSKKLHADIIELAVRTGMRKSELLSLTWDAIELGAREIFLSEEVTKNGRARVIPLDDASVSLLRGWERHPGTHQLCWHQDWAGTVQPMIHIERWWRGTLRRSGLADVKFHDLRHTFASWWCQDGKNLLALKAILGHQSMAMVERYSHLATQHLHEAMKGGPKHSLDTPVKGRGHTRLELVE